MKKAVILVALAAVFFSCKRTYICDCRTDTAMSAYQNDVMEENPPKHLVESWGEWCEGMGCMWYEKP